MVYFTFLVAVMKKKNEPTRLLLVSTDSHCIPPTPKTLGLHVTVDEWR